MYLKRLPDILKDITVGGNFFCGNNNLTSLENCPKTVGGDFYCGYNKLTSLEGAPEIAFGGFALFLNGCSVIGKLDCHSVCLS